jgi:hypothetical protein
MLGIISPNVIVHDKNFYNLEEGQINNLVRTFQISLARVNECPQNTLL